jgi:hypothetical protein
MQPNYVDIVRPISPAALAIRRKVIVVLSDNVIVVDVPLELAVPSAAAAAPAAVAGQPHGVVAAEVTQQVV